MLKKIKLKFRNWMFRTYRVNSFILAASMVNNKTFSKYKDINQGEDVVLCGAGPTLNKYIPLKKVKHFALNRALLNEKIKFDYFIADDWDGVNFMQDFLMNYDCIKFFGHQIGNYEREIPETFARKCGADRHYTDSFMVPNGYESEPVADINYLPIGNMPNIALSALQIVLFTNPKRIYLVGCDASANGHYIESGISEKQKEKHNSDMKYAITGDKVFDCWRKLKTFIETFYPDIEIVSVNPVGLKGLFKDCHQNESGELIYE